MPNVETQIITRALEYPGLLSRTELEFVVRISKLPARSRLTTPQLNWLCDIGERKLSMVFQRPEREPVVDLKARACA